MKHTGFSFLFDASIALVLLTVLFLVAQQKVETGADELILSQKMHDLLIIWAKERNFSREELDSDFEFVFPVHAGIIEVQGEKIELKKPGEKNKKKIVESINFVGEDFQLKKITLTVFD